MVLERQLVVLPLGKRGVQLDELAGHGQGQIDLCDLGDALRATSLGHDHLDELGAAAVELVAERVQRRDSLSSIVGPTRR